MKSTNHNAFCLDDSPQFRWIELDEVDSTNTFLRGYRPAQLATLTLVTAEHQTAGRGQGTNHWEAETGKNLLFSLLLQPASLPVSQMFVLSEAIALSILEAVQQALTATPPHPLGTGFSTEAAAQEAVTVNWPNDVYVRDLKIAGILIENELTGQHLGRSIIGCGVNVNQQRFLSDAPNPVSLYQLLQHETERRFVLEDIMAAFTRRYEDILQGNYTSIHAEYLSALYRRTGFHPYRDADGTFLAEIADVEPSGHLVLRDERGLLRRYAFKEVAFD